MLLILTRRRLELNLARLEKIQLDGSTDITAIPKKNTIALEPPLELGKISHIVNGSGGNLKIVNNPIQATHAMQLEPKVMRLLSSTPPPNWEKRFDLKLPFWSDQLWNCDTREQESNRHRNELEKN